MSLRVLEPGLHTLVVDAGRPATRSLGVPLAGAADRFSWMLGNLLVGNPVHAPALEICLAGPTLQAECDVGAALVGAPFDLFRGDIHIAPNRSFNLKRGDVLRIGGTARLARGYLCVGGGFQEPIMLGSQSSLDPLKRGQELNCRESTVAERGIHWPPEVSNGGPARVRALLGLQADWFELERFFGPVFQATPASDRMGVRLLGEPLRRPNRELVSEPVAPGAVQIVNDGQCIVLGVDGQTIGGYPKVAHVIAADQDRIGQLRPREEVVFELANLDEAEAARRERQQALRAWKTRLTVY